MAWQGLISNCSRCVLLPCHLQGLKEYLACKKCRNKSQQGGSAGDGACHQVWQPEFAPQSPYTPSCRPSSDLHMCPWHTVMQAVYRCAYSYKVNRMKGFPQGRYFLLLFVVFGIEFQVSRYQAWALPPSFPSPEFWWQTACQKVPGFLRL